MFPFQPIQIMLISAHPLWIQACDQILGSLPRRIEVIPVLAAQEMRVELTGALRTYSDIAVAVVSLDLPLGSLGLVRTLRAAGYGGAIVVLCSRYALPSLQELQENRVQNLVSSMATFQEVSAAIYAAADDQSPPLLQQYLQTVRTLNRQPHEEVLNERERAILQLVAADLTDGEIATRLQISVRTVNNNLHHVYTKLGVKGRAGAVAVALLQGITFDEQRDYFRYRTKPKEKVTLPEQRRMFRHRFGALEYLLMGA